MAGLKERQLVVKDAALQDLQQLHQGQPLLLKYLEDE